MYELYLPFRTNNTSGTELKIKAFVDNDSYTILRPT